MTSLVPLPSLALAAQLTTGVVPCPADSEPCSRTTSTAEATTASAVTTAVQDGGGALTSLDPLLPIEFTAFGDLRYAWPLGERGHFEIGSLELDVALSLSDHVAVATAVAYDPAADSFGVPAFTVDGSLAGPEDKHVIRTDWLDDSGVVLGKFDVPFGIAYLRYASTDNPYVLTPLPVALTHGGWNDIGAQGYAVARHFNVTAWWVDGVGLVAEEAVPDPAVGGRLGLAPIPELELGGSAASTILGERDRVFGADLALRTELLTIENEVIARRAAQETDWGAYTQALGRIEWAFLGARYETAFLDRALIESGVGGVLGAEVFPRAEVRVAGTHDLESRETTVFFQIVGGSSWQPTGLRR